MHPLLDNGIVFDNCRMNNDGHPAAARPESVRPTWERGPIGC